MPDPAALGHLARGLLAGVAVAWTDPLRAYPLLAGEALPGAVPKRLRAFSAGRHAARAAMAQLGLGLVALPAGDDRAPVWPAGVVGSITHSDTVCLATVGLSADWAGLGLDIEEDTPLDRDLWDTVLVPEEQIWLARQPQAARGGLAKLMFSAKEAAYKAQYAQSRTLFGFDAMVLTLGDGAFAARFRHAIAPFAAGDTVQGRYAHAEGHVLTLAFLRP